MSGPVKVLVVSDKRIEPEQWSLLFSTAALNLAFVEVVTYEELVEAAERESWATIILRLRGTHLTICDALGYLRAIAPDLPLFVFASRSNREELIAAIRAGATDYVSEEDEQELVRVVTAALENSGGKSASKSIAAGQPGDRFLAFIHESVSEPLACVSVAANGEFRFSSVNGPFMREAVKFGDPMKLDQIIGCPIDKIFRKKWNFSNEEWVRFLGLLNEAATTRKRVGPDLFFQGAPNGRKCEFALVPLLTGESSCEHVLISFRDLDDEEQRENWRGKREGDYLQPQKMESIGALASGIAHDFNNILTCILGYADICMLRARPGDPVCEGLEQILSASLRARDLISQILAFGRKCPLEKKRIDLSGVVGEAMKLLKGSTPGNVLVVARLPNRGPEILADSSQILQILLNLCTNAFHAMENEGGKLTIWVERVRVDETDTDIDPEHIGRDFARMTVADSGAGMDMETVQRVFEPFFTTKNPGSGTGLGLSMVRGIVTSHGGFVRVESRLGQGSRFHVFLPLSPSKLDLEVVPVDSLLAGRQDRAREKILVIDDDEEIANLAVRILRSHAYRVEAIHEPRDAIERLRSSPHEFALVLTDLIMDDLSGRDVVRELKMINPDVPVVLVSGCASILSEEAAYQEGFAAVIHKPFGSEQLASDVAQVLGRVNGL